MENAKDTYLIKNVNFFQGEKEQNYTPTRGEKEQNYTPTRGELPKIKKSNK